MFYKKELQKINQREFRIGKVINRKGNKLYVKWKGYDHSFIVGLIKKIFSYKMSYFLEPHTFKKKIEVELDLSNYARKYDLKSATGVNRLQFTKKDDLSNLKSEVDKFNIGKSETTLADVSKLSNVVGNAVKKI